jgi:hypothetical protein
MALAWACPLCEKLQCAMAPLCRLKWHTPGRRPLALVSPFAFRANYELRAKKTLAFEKVQLKPFTLDHHGDSLVCRNPLNVRPQ